MLAMQNEVLRELNHALARHGTPTSLSFCHVDVEGVIQRISREVGVSAGRTSDRRRNSANGPRAWAAPLVAAHAGRPAKSIDGYAVDLGDNVGVLRPIVQQPMCSGCHGTAERLAPGVLVILKQRYPSDRATGFRDGEIRGWFWVEVPKQHIMTVSSEVCRPDDNLAQAVSQLWSVDCGVLPVVDHAGCLAGIVTDRDICIALGTRSERASEVQVRTVMRTSVATCNPGEDVISALARMGDHQVRRLTVVDDERRLLGIVSLGDAALAAG
jgi:CBS domain-containing protein